MGKQILASILFILGLFVLMGMAGTSDYESLYSFGPFLPFWQFVLGGLSGLGMIFLSLRILEQPSQIKGG